MEFSPERAPFARYFIKYEWQQSLCEKGVLECAPPAPLSLDDLDIHVVDSRGRPFELYPIAGNGETYRAYLEAEPNANYAVRVSNRSDQRIGVVIAVDGRNIISGERSELQPGERMYILEPQQTATYQGWRTGENRVNEFYFTDAGDSYSAAWGDYSAMGVIALAAFQQDPRYQHQGKAKVSEVTPRAKSRADQAGTGFGDERYSPSRRVEFAALENPFGRYFIKYEWRETLCEKQVIKCERRNRLWDEDDNRNKDEGFVTPPQRRQQQQRSTKASEAAEDWAQKYAEAAVAQQRENLSRRCDFRGGHWHADYDRHYRYALNTSKGTARAEIQRRERDLLNCRLQ